MITCHALPRLHICLLWPPPSIPPLPEDLPFLMVHQLVLYCLGWHWPHCTQKRGTLSHSGRAKGGCPMCCRRPGRCRHWRYERPGRCAYGPRAYCHWPWWVKAKGPPRCLARRGGAARIHARIRVGASGRRPATLSPGEGPPANVAGPAGKMAAEGRLRAGPGALGLGASVGTGLRLGHIRGAGPGLRVPRKPGAPS